jgi:hypothetical protein
VDGAGVFGVQHPQAQALGGGWRIGYGGWLMGHGLDAQSSISLTQAHVEQIQIEIGIAIEIETI